MGVPVVEELSDEIYSPTGIYAEVAAVDDLKTHMFTTKNILAVLWLTGVILMVARLMTGWYRLRRICLSAEAVSENSGLGNRNVRILLTSQVQGPVCFGLFRGAILLPRQIYENTVADKLEMILNHELAHIERKDYLTNLFQRVVEAILFFHPFLWYASLQLTQQREQICDNHVLAEGASADDYTVLLTQIVEKAMHEDRLGAVALIEGRLLSRVRFLLNPDRSQKTKLSIRAVFICTATILTSFGIFGTVRLAAKTETAMETTKVKSDKTDIALTNLRRESVENLSQFGLILAAYAADHQDKFPDTLEDLFDSIREEPSTYGLTEELGNWANYNVRYFGKGKTIKDSGETAIAYGNSLFEAPASEGTNVLFVNGQVKFIKKDRLKKLDSMPKTVLEILDIKIDPIRQGTNVIRVKVQNKTEQAQMFRLQMYTRSPGVGGWGTSSFDTIEAGKIKLMRHACKIRGPVTDGTYIRLDFHNPGSAASFDMDKWRNGERTDWFKRVRYDSSDLEHYKIDKSLLKEASKGEAEAVVKTLRQIQGHIKNKEYESAWNLFTQDFREAEFQLNGYERFKQMMESPQRYALSGLELLALEPKSVSRQNNIFVLAAAMRDKLWTVDFVRAGGQYKLDSIGGVISNDWQERLLPMLEKRTTKHFDIYYFKGSTAGKEIEQIIKEKEKGFAEICRFLDKDSDQRIKMVFFEDGETKRRVTAHQGAGWAFGNTIVEIYNEEQKLDPYHETVHILMHPFGNPPVLFSEGFAVYMSERLGAKALKNLSGGQSSIYQRVRELKSKNEWIPLDELITYTNIGSAQSRPPVSYPEAASFVKFLIDSYGKDKFLETYKILEHSGNKQIQKRNIEKLTNIYGKSLIELGKQWEETFMKSQSQ